MGRDGWRAGVTDILYSECWFGDGRVGVSGNLAFSSFFAFFARALVQPLWSKQRGLQVIAARYRSNWINPCSPRAEVTGAGR